METKYFTVSFDASAPTNYYLTSDKTTYYSVSDCGSEVYMDDLVYRTIKYSYPDDFACEVGTLVKEIDSVSFPKYNVWRDDSNIYIELAVAGYTKDDIKIKISENVLFVFGKKKEEKEKDYIIKKLTNKEWKIAFGLTGINIENDIDARYENGILIIKLPLEKEFIEKEIKIK